MEIAMLANSLANSIVLVLHLIRTESVSSNVLTHVFTNRPRLYQVFQRFSRLESKNKQRPYRKHAATALKYSGLFLTLIGASLNEPHTSEYNGGIFIYYQRVGRLSM